MRIQCQFVATQQRKSRAPLVEVEAASEKFAAM